MVVTTPAGIATIDMRTRRNTLILPRPTAKILMVGRKSSRLWYIDEIGGQANPLGEWMVAAEMYHPRTGRPLTFAEQKEVRINQRLEQRPPMTLFVVDVASGARRDVHHATDWLNHLQFFSPTEPNQILFCHERPWHKVDRIWTIRTDGLALSKIHTRTMNMEIAGHEFFSQDGGHLVFRSNMHGEIHTYAVALDEARP
ncbi:oligogalacturonate lyase family protein [Brenneria populi]|uniref:Oligogalacturonate lyase family protein n=1 Tax=Brenneria populi TaxID=1505588 RepID=A0ABU6JWY6_9GAMM|nr:oligogalacturonate lyase family protein [Brenneria populi Li et al. 2015]